MHDFWTHSCTFRSLQANRGLFSLVIRCGRQEERRPLSTVATVFVDFAPALLGTLSSDDDDGRENTTKKINLRPFKLYRVYEEPLNSSFENPRWSDDYLSKIFVKIL